MRYTETEYQSFLEHIIQELITEHNRIGLSADAWKSSFKLLTPDFQKKARLLPN